MSGVAGNIVIWFKRDLRIEDHPALAHAADLAAETGAQVLPLYIVEPDYWREPDTSLRQWAFTAECLVGLREALGRLGAPLIVRTGEAVRTLAALCRDHDVRRIISHEETGTLWTYARDRRVAAFCREAGIVWEEVPQTGVIRRLRRRGGWAAMRNAAMAGPLAPTPLALQGRAIDLGLIPEKPVPDVSADPCPRRQEGGRRAGLALLGSFLASRGENYRKAMSSPVTGAAACSRLSPHLALGTLSSREIARAVAGRRLERPMGRWPGALSSFESRLAWRDHFMQRLEDHPALERDCLDRAAEHRRPRMGDAARLAAWSQGQTGLPFVDACMRSLRATGWLNFRMRSMLMAVASYHLWLDWRQTGPVLARAFTDYEPGIHWSQVQMQSGTTGFNVPRIYNPVKQGFDQDPTGEFTRFWCPELAAVPDAYLQTPWEWPEASSVLERHYPAPIVDVAASARAARDAIFGLRQGRSGEIATVRRFEKPKKAAQPKPSSQLSLDL